MGACKSVPQVSHHTQCHAPSPCQCDKYLITHNRAPSPCQWNNTSSHTIMHHHHNHPLTMQTAPHRCTQVSATSTSSHTMSCTTIMSVQQVPHHTQCHAPPSCQCNKYLITHNHAPSPCHWNNIPHRTRLCQTPSPCQWNNTSSHVVMHHHHPLSLTIQTAPHRCTGVRPTCTSSTTLS